VRAVASIAAVVAAFTTVPVAAEPLTSVWTLESAATVETRTVPFGKPFLEMQLVPARVVQIAGDAEWAPGKQVTAGTLLFKVYKADGQSAYCTAKDLSGKNAAKSLFIPALDNRPCFIDADHDGQFEAAFTVFDKYGSALTPSGNLNSATKMARPITYAMAPMGAVPKLYRVSFALVGSRKPEKFGIEVRLKKGEGNHIGELLYAESQRDGAKLSFANMSVTMQNVVGKEAVIDLAIDPAMLFLGSSNGAFNGALPSALPKDWNM
jgi:hypothetical protein